MNESFSGRVAVIADTLTQRQALQQALLLNGYQVVLCAAPEQLDEQRLEACAADLWLVDLASPDEAPLVEHLLEQACVPLLFGEDQAPPPGSEQYLRWERRLLGKLKRLLGDPAAPVGLTLAGVGAQLPAAAVLPLPATLPAATGVPAQQVWLLAASLGGPPAVKAFLDALPAGLPLAFVYAQHIDAAFETQLPQAVGRHSQWTVGAPRDGDWLRCGEVVVAPVGCELGFAEDGRMRLTAGSWPEPYSPSIDQMMLNLAQRFAGRCGVIAFSGMGSDGSAAAAYLRRQGGQIWTQSAASCVCSGLPDSLREAGHSTRSGSPRELAEALVAQLAECAADVLAGGVR